ncbi:MAG: hypothetical protein JEZ14_11460 [Marinilabiliaceae bacterium]|nr:hypothetical protein [Marinilabiliaceae bacterium]
MGNLKVKNKFGVLFISMFFLLIHCGQAINLVPKKANKTPNYWCTWYWQNYLINAGQSVINPDPNTVFTNEAARNELTEESIFGKNGMAVVMLPKTRGDYYFLIDHGWQDKLIKVNTFFTFLMDDNDFPCYSHLSPQDKIKKFNEDIQALGWRGLGLWVRGNVTHEEGKRFVEWSRYAGIEYWKIDGGDTKDFVCYNIKQKIYPELYLEYVTGAGPLNLSWDKPNLPYYPSVYEPGAKHIKGKAEGPGTASQALNVLKNSDVFRTYDAVPLLVSTVTLQRIHDILKLTANKPEYTSILNIQDDCNIAAALGCAVAVKRHPMNTPRMYKGKDYHLQIRGERHVENRLNEMDRLALWQRIAPPVSAGYGTYKFSNENLIDHIVFRAGDTWLKSTWDKEVTQSAPAIMARNIDLPIVKCKGEKPYVMAGKFGNGAICIATEGRVKPDDSWFHPKANITVNCGFTKFPVGIFGYYESLTLNFKSDLNKNSQVYLQDLLSKRAINVTKKIKVSKNSITIPGELIELIGTSKNNKSDISCPGLVMKIIEK